MPSLLGRLYTRLGVGYFWVFVGLEIVSAMVVCLATVGMFRLYTEMSTSEFWKVTLFAQACTVVAILNTAARSRSSRGPCATGFGTGTTRAAPRARGSRR